MLFVVFCGVILALGNSSYGIPERLKMEILVTNEVLEKERWALEKGGAIKGEQVRGRGGRGICLFFLFCYVIFERVVLLSWWIIPMMAFNGNYVTCANASILLIDYICLFVLGISL